MQFRQTWLNAEPNWRLAATIARFADQVQTVRLGTLHDRATQDIVIDGLTRLVNAFVRRDASAVETLTAEFVGHAEACYFAVHAGTRTKGWRDKPAPPSDMSAAQAVARCREGYAMVAAENDISVVMEGFKKAAQQVREGFAVQAGNAP
jgi:hypothetical protein